MEDLIDASFRFGFDGPEVDFRGLRRLVVAVDAGEIFQLAAPRLGIQPFDVAALTFFQRRIDEDESTARAPQ